MEKRKITIIGAGIGGLTLAYALARCGRFDITVISAKDADDVRNGRLLSTQGHFERLLKTEQRHEMPDYGEAYDFKSIELMMEGRSLFKGNLNERAISMDQRLYLSTMINGLAAKGIAFVKRRLHGDDLTELTEQSDLIIDCTGKIGPIAPFTVSNEVCNAPTAPLRVISAGIFRGIKWKSDHTMRYNIIPGLGELFEMVTATHGGPAVQFLLEAVPSSPLDLIRGDNGPAAFAEQFKHVLQDHFPHIHERIDGQSFRLADDNAYLRTAIKPVVRIPYTTIGSKLVLGCGDSVVINDPITGQGANCASYCADMLYEAIAEDVEQEWDQAFGERYWQRIRTYVIRMSEWSNAMMGPPSAHFCALMEQASKDQRAADQLVQLFTDPVQAHAAFFTGVALSN